MVQPADWDPHPEPLALDTAPLPEYGSGSLADLLPTLAAGMDVPGMTAAIPELTAADRACVFLIDGLGWEDFDEREMLEGFARMAGSRMGVAFAASFEVYSLTWGGLDED